jgi:hypothetical protein
VEDLSILSFAIAAAACGAAGMERHQRGAFGRELTWARGIGLRTGSWALLLASYVLAVALHGPGIGSIEWICLVGCAALGVGIVLAYRPRWLPAIAAAAAGIAVVCVAAR